MRAATAADPADNTIQLQRSQNVAVRRRATIESQNSIQVRCLDTHDTCMVDLGFGKHLSQIKLEQRVCQCQKIYAN
jgi:hypothetical protein